MQTRELGRMKRHGRIRKKLSGTPEKPRLSVHRSLKNLYVQLIDDVNEQTLYSFSTLDKKFAESCGKAKKVTQAEKLGQFFGKRVMEKGIQAIAFDRGGYIYHGRIKALAESFRMFSDLLLSHSRTR